MDVEKTEGMFDGDWKENYPHTKGADWLDVSSYRLIEDDRAEGIYFVYELCRDGGMFQLLVDIKEHTPDKIRWASEKLYRDRDVVSLDVLRFKKFEL
jgi:hypothetical protein